MAIFREMSMGQLERLKEAQWAARDSAIQRWKERTAVRGKNLRNIATGGQGAADSPMRNERFKAREAAFAKARILRAEGRLPFGLERKIGPTLDFSPFAPSDGARTAGRPVARVVTLGGPGIVPQGFGTCFLVTPRLALTNHHVFPTKADAVGTGANFMFEQGDRGIAAGVTFEIDPESFYYSDEKLDFALVGVKSKSLDGNPLADFAPILLVEATPKILIGQPVNIIQYPEGGPKQYAVTQNRLVDLLDTGFLHYDTDTLPGSSGSPAFSVDWQLVGLHHAAIPEMRGDKVITVRGGVWDRSMSEDEVHWIANEGIRVSSIVKALGSVRLDGPKQELLSELMALTADPTDELVKETAKLDPNGHLNPPPDLSRLGPTMGGGTAFNNFNFVGPVTIHVYGPAAHAAPAMQPQAPQPLPASAVVAVEKVMRFDPDYKHREGYDPKFLDPEDDAFEVPVPGVISARSGELLMGRDGKPRVLKYHHYELVMNQDRFLQMWSAVNVDYDPELKATGDRKSFGTDKWIPDPRIPGELQIQDPEFYKPAGNIDRGHIVRREDNAWGHSEEEIEFANSDTFHWTNCTPQHEAFNQSTPGKNDPTYIGMKGLWGDFENHVQKSLGGADTRACILAGPVLASNDPIKDFGFGDIQYPLQFWKVIAVPTAPDGKRRLTVFGFLLSQVDVVKKFGIEKFVPGKFKKYQVSLASITAVTGVTFHPSLHEADVMAGETSTHAIAADETLKIGNRNGGSSNSRATVAVTPPVAKKTAPVTKQKR